jgi:tetratricopeptide (TPR) repeat protein
MMRKDPVIAILLLLGGLTSAAHADQLASGDAAFVGLRYAEARAIYMSALQSDPRSPAALWRLARLANVEAGGTSGEAKHAGYREAEQYARRCVAADTTVAEGYAWLAVSLGNLAMFEGSKAKVRMCTEIKGALDKALVLKPDDDIAYTILGSFYRALGNVSWIERQLATVFLGSLPDGGYPEAEAALKKAVALAPGTLRHRKELGMLYVDWGKDAEARTVLQESLRLPSLLASDDADKQRIREALAELD